MARAPRVPRIAAPHAGPIVGIDVETACSEHGAICSIGVSVVVRGAVLRERQWFLDPGTRFDPRFIGIHGITPAKIAGEPRLAQMWRSLLAFIDDAVAHSREQAREPSHDQTLFSAMNIDPPIALVEHPAPLYVAHNAAFDRLQIEHALAAPLPFRVACTVAMSRRAYPTLGRHNLATVAAHLRIALNHHDALSDARACALIAHHCIAAGAGA